MISREDAQCSKDHGVRAFDRDGCPVNVVEVASNNTPAGFAVKIQRPLVGATWVSPLDLTANLVDLAPLR